VLTRRHAGLGKLIAVYDDNGISIDSEKGNISQWYTDDVRRRFEGYGWQVIPERGRARSAAVDKALRKAKRETKRPSLICCKTVIAKGAPTKANTGAAHGAALGKDEVRRRARRSTGRIRRSRFRNGSTKAGMRASAAPRRSDAGRSSSPAYAAAHPAEAAEFPAAACGRSAGRIRVARRQARAGSDREGRDGSRRARLRRTCSRTLVPALPELVGGSADLTGSNLTMVKASKVIGREDGGNYLFYGVREFGMCAVMNGLAPARRLHPVRRHLSRVLRLRAQRPAPARR
jgi:transketolase